ncbi:MAG TPA: RraA family protein [Terriglobia bacterium]|nr:RraA family protein [Terriglobia bacterium]
MDPSLTAEQFEALRRLDGCTLANAIETFNIRLRNEGFASHAAVHCIFPDLPPMLGYAVTGRIRSASPPIASSLPPPQTLTFAHRDDWWSYVLSVPEPRVVVLRDVDPSPGLGAFIGDVHSAICQALGCVGYVTNGAVRDTESVRASRFHLFARHISVSHAYAHLVDFGESVEVGGMHVRPGDLIHGDRNGVQTVPNHIAAKLPAVAAHLGRKERRIIEFSKSREFTLDKLRAIITDAEDACSAATVNFTRQEQEKE